MIRVRVLALTRLFHPVVVDRDARADLLRRLVVGTYPSLLVLGPGLENIHRFERQHVVRFPGEPEVSLAAAVRDAVGKRLGEDPLLAAAEEFVPFERALELRGKESRVGVAAPALLPLRAQHEGGSDLPVRPRVARAHRAARRRVDEVRAIILGPGDRLRGRCPVGFGEPAPPPRRSAGR